MNYLFVSWNQYFFHIDCRFFNIYKNLLDFVLPSVIGYFFYNTLANFGDIRKVFLVVEWNFNFYLITLK